MNYYDSTLIRCLRLDYHRLESPTDALCPGTVI